ncbi:MAG: Ig-like domain-containing protein, partial [Pseudomonadales bacterium]
MKVSGTKSTDTTSIQIEIDDEDGFGSAKTTTLSGLGTETTYADATGIDVTTATALSDGTIAIRITASDAAGNTSNETVLTVAATFNKDVGVPASPSVPDLATADDSGDSSTDNITKNTTALTFTGTAEADATVQLYDGASTPVGSSTTATGGTWSIDLSLAGGSYLINAKATDASGNESAASGNLSVTIDTSAPAVPSAATIASGTGWNTDYITSSNATAVKVSGTKSTDTTSIQIEIDDEDTFGSAKTTTLSGLGTGTTYADATGIDVTTATALSDGTIAIRITASDAAGNSSNQTVLTGAATFKKDVSVPASPSVPDLAAADDTGDSSTDDITKNTSGLTFTGTAEADATVQLYDGASTPVGSSTAATGGNWSIDLSLAENSYSINAKATDASGNESSASGNLSVTVDTSAPTAPSAATIASGSGWNTNYITGANATAVKVSGTKTTDTTSIQIEIDDEDTFASAKTTTLSGLGAVTSYADATGIDVTTATALTDGNIAVRITASDVAGNTSNQTVLT